MEKKRYVILDEIRGFAVLCMVFFHAFFTFGFLFQWRAATTLFHFFEPAEPFFAFVFIFISGICSKLSRSNLRRGAWLAVIAVGLTAVTAIMQYRFGMKEVVIYFGVLHLLAVCMLLYAAVGRWIDRIPTVFCLCFFLVLTLLTFHVRDGYLLYRPFAVMLPGGWYQSDWLIPLGFAPPNFYSADYFPLLPWLFAFLAGTAAGRYAANDRLPAFCSKMHLPPFAFCGRHSLIIYLAHQPVIYAIGLLIQAFQ